MKDDNKMRITKTVECIEDFRDLEHFVYVRGGNIIRVTSNSRGMEVLYEL